MIRGRRGRHRLQDNYRIPHPPAPIQPEIRVDSQPPSAELLPPAGWQAPLVDLVATIARRWWILLLLLLLGAFGGYQQYESTPPYFRAAVDAILLPREKPLLDTTVSSGSVATTDGSASREATGSLMLPASTELYTAILKSRAVLLTLAERFHDQLEISDSDRSDEILDLIKGMAKVSGTEEGMINVEVTANDALFAAELANAMIEEMQTASKEIERQLLIQQAGYLGDTVKQMESDLTDREEELATFKVKHGIVEVEGQLANHSREIRQLNERLDRLEQDRAELLETRTEDSAEVEATDNAITQTTEQIRVLERSWFGQYRGNDLALVLIEYDRLNDRVRQLRDIIATLDTQRTIFEIRKEQPAGSLAIIRPAVPDWVKAGPSKSKTFGVAIILALILGVVAVLLLEQWNGAVADPYISQRMTEIRRSLFSVVGFAVRPVRRAIRRSKSRLHSD
ncbi:MAG: hypothetical protein AAF196_18465 [Planctomycetota bacterium]